jgi:hypothetical protein
MSKEPLDSVPLWLLFVAVCVVTGLALEGGYRLGRWRHTHSEEEKPTPIGAMVGSVVALFAFMLAFTFGMAASRFETRRQAVLEEANAIGTTYLRTRLLRDEGQRNVSARLLREYVDVRVRAIPEGKIEEALTRSEELHERLWDEAIKAAESDRGPITGLYVQSLNQMIDLHAKRIQAGLRSRIPTVIWLGLFALAMLSMASVGYQSGISATRRSPQMFVIVLAFAGVMFLIADLDRAREGFLIVNQEAMNDLQRTMNAARP